MSAARGAPTAAWRRVAWSMGLGAAYDAVFGVAILLFAAPAARVMGLALPADRSYLGLNGVFLLLLAALYTLPARDPVRYAGVVAVAGAGRAAGFAYLGLVWLHGHGAAFAALAVGDLVFAVAHVVLLTAARREAQVPDTPGT